MPINCPACTGLVPGGGIDKGLVQRQESLPTRKLVGTETESAMVVRQSAGKTDIRGRCRPKTKLEFLNIVLKDSKAGPKVSI